MATMKIDTTKRGFAAMWESGGGMTSGGSSVIITGRNGEARRPIYMPRGGHLAGGQHALIGVSDGFHIVTASVRRGERESAAIKRIVSTKVVDIHGQKFEATAEVEVVNTFAHGEWDKPLDEKFAAAVAAAFRKASTYHCRSAVYVDSSDRAERSADDKRRADEQARAQDAKREKLRQAKAEADAREKAEREAASRAAKEAGLGARLDAANDRIAALGPNQASSLALHDENGFSFKYGWQTLLYTEENVASFERRAEQMEREDAEKRRKQTARETWQPKFEALKPRAEALGLRVDFGEESVRFLGGDFYGDAYSEEGLAQFAAKIIKKAQAEREAEAKAQAEERYQTLKVEGAKLGLPQNVQIWKRTGGATNAGCGWVIAANGMDREPTSMYNPRPRYQSEGDMTWEQILPGEVVLKWAKAYTAAPHEFTVVHVPSEGLTPAQLERIAEIQNELIVQWNGRSGMSGNTSSPPVGDGWGFNSKPKLAPTPAPAPTPKPGVMMVPADLSQVDLTRLFGGNATVKNRR